MEAEAHDAWQKAALEPPRAYGETPVSGAVRVEHADFVVEERLGFEADGGDAHRLLLVEKVGTNTLFVRARARGTGRQAAGRRRLRGTQGPPSAGAAVVLSARVARRRFVRGLRGRRVSRAARAAAFAQASAAVRWPAIPSRSGFGACRAMPTRSPRASSA
jgi:hypothetical protein